MLPRRVAALTGALLLSLTAACGAPPPDRVVTVGRPLDSVAVEAGDGAAYARVLRFASAVSYRRTLDFAAALQYRGAIEIAVRVVRAERAQEAAEADRRADAQQATREPVDEPVAPPPPTQDGSVDAHLWRIAACESGTNPRAVSPTGRYRGAWQWSLATFHAYGGVGDPIDSPLSVQLVVARATYRGQGPGAWPVCRYR